eukprot:11434981-Karenia_brevis.AAC.1
MGARILRAISGDEPLALMRCPQQQLPQPSNNPTLGVELNYQSVPEVDTIIANLVWKGDLVATECPPPPPPWKPTVARGTPSNVT